MNIIGGSLAFLATAAVFVSGAVLGGGPLSPGTIGEATASMNSASSTRSDLLKTSFEALPGWLEDNHAEALTAFRRFCDEPHAVFQNDLFDLPNMEAAALCAAAKVALTDDVNAARIFFETFFVPYKIAQKGFVTGYFEPELPASRTQSEIYSVPLLKVPDGLQSATGANRPDGWSSGLTHGRRGPEGLEPMPDRGQIMDGALRDEDLELVWLANSVDAFFVHVQGSARLLLDDVSTMRVGYAGKTGHPYTSIARVLVERGEGTPEELTMAGLRRWLASNPDRRDALLRRNRSFIFFREVTTQPEEGPVGAAGIPLVAGRSLAVDRARIPFGLPVYVQADFADSGLKGSDFARLMVADDTGSAIKGAARGDIFVGSGEAAGAIAGDIRNAAEMTLLIPAEAQLKSVSK